MKQLWAEDGHFIFSIGTHTRFGWTRSISLRDPQKDEKYGIESGITEEMIQLIQDNGDYIEFVGGQYHPRWILSGAKLHALEESDDTFIASLAHKFSSILERNKPSLLISEQHLLSRFNVETRPNCDEVSHYIGTGRVSALWRIRTKPLDDAMRVAILTPPDDIIKNQKAQSWMLSEQDRYSRILHEIKDQSYQMSLEKV